MFQNYLAKFIDIFVNLLVFAIFVRVVLSWMRVQPRGFLFTLLVETTEPILSFFRKLIPPLGGMLDLSPVIAYLALSILRDVLINLLT